MFPATLAATRRAPAFHHRGCEAGGDWEAVLKQGTKNSGIVVAERYSVETESQLQ